MDTTSIIESKVWGGGGTTTMSLPAPPPFSVLRESESSPMKVSLLPLYGTEPDCKFQPNGFTRARLHTSGASLTTIHAIKRAAESEVATMAITELVQFHSSASCNREMLAVAVGQIPIASGAVDTYRFPAECRCSDYCQWCAGAFVLDVRHPLASGESGESIMVTSYDLKPLDISCVPGFRRGSSEVFLTDRTMMDHRAEEPLAPVSEKPIPLTRLAPGQAVRFFAIVRKGKAGPATAGTLASGKMFQSTVQFAIRDALDIRIHRSTESKLSPARRKAIAVMCPQQVFDVEDVSSMTSTSTDTATAETKEPDTRLKVVSPGSCSDCGLCTTGLAVKGILPHPLISIHRKKSEFDLHIESTGSLSAMELAARGCEAMVWKSEQLLASLEELLPKAEDEAADTKSVPVHAPLPSSSFSRSSS